MKSLKKIIISALSFTLRTIMSSCMIVLHEQDHGKHKGWYKNPHNPHHPKTTNPGHQKPKKKGHK